MLYLAIMEWVISQEEADIILTTYQRSGSHFLLYCVGQLVDVKIHKSHDHIYSNKPVFSIIRNPLESIASHSAMNLHFDKSYDYETSLRGCIDDYIGFYKYLKTVDYIFLYEQVILDPKPIINKIADISNVKMKAGAVMFPLEYIKNDIKTKMDNHGSVASSKDLLDYHEIVKRLESIDLSECLSLYQEAYDRAILFPEI